MFANREIHRWKTLCQCGAAEGQMVVKDGRFKKIYS